MVHVRDSLYGYIEIDDDELDIVDTPQMQRLRRIKQLGFSEFVYPGATHTRFEHSLGVMHVAGNLAETVGLDDETVKEVRLAGLLHDSGHGPFSHASEQVKHGKDHEYFSCKVVDELSDKIPADTERVKKHIKGETDLDIISGEINADRMDYLKRDSYATGLEHGHVDTETIVKFADIKDGRLAFSRKSIQALEGFLTARLHMYKSVYKHHASVISEKMLEYALDDYVVDNSLEDMMRKNDYEMHSALLNSDGLSKELYERLTRRDLYKRCVVMGDDEISREELSKLSEQNPYELEEKISNRAGIESKFVIVDLPSPPSEERIDIPIIDSNGKVKNISEFTLLPDNLQDAEWRSVTMNVYTPQEYIDTVQEPASRLIIDLLR